MSDTAIRLRRWHFDTREVDEYGNENNLFEQPKGENLTDEEALGIILSKDTLERLTKGQRTVVSAPQIVQQWEPPKFGTVTVPLGVRTEIKAAVSDLLGTEDRYVVANNLERLLRLIESADPC